MEPEEGSDCLGEAKILAAVGSDLNLRAARFLQSGWRVKMDAIMLRESDNVATALRDLAEGEEIVVGVQERSVRVRVRQPIAFGHKLAVSDIGQGEHVLKYGEVIGRATQAIQAGFHAHIHNIESLRGRGDLEAAEKSHGV